MDKRCIQYFPYINYSMHVDGGPYADGQTVQVPSVGELIIIDKAKIKIIAREWTTTSEWWIDHLGDLRCVTLYCEGIDE